MLEIPVALLTTAGRELFQIVECTPDWGYLRAFSKFLMSKDCRLDYLAGVESLPGGMVRYTNRIPIEPKSEQVDGANTMTTSNPKRLIEVAFPLKAGLAGLGA